MPMASPTSTKHESELRARGSSPNSTLSLLHTGKRKEIYAESGLSSYAALGDDG